MIRRRVDRQINQMNLLDKNTFKDGGPSPDAPSTGSPGSAAPVKAGASRLSSRARFARLGRLGYTGPDIAQSGFQNGGAAVSLNATLGHIALALNDKIRRDAEARPLALRAFNQADFDEKFKVWCGTKNSSGAYNDPYFEPASQQQLKDKLDYASAEDKPKVQAEIDAMYKNLRKEFAKGWTAPYKIGDYETTDSRWGFVTTKKFKGIAIVGNGHTYCPGIHYTWKDVFSEAYPNSSRGRDLP